MDIGIEIIFTGSGGKVVWLLLMAERQNVNEQKCPEQN